MDRTEIALGNRRIPLIVRRHRRARRISLRLSAARDAIVMTLPMRATVASGMRFFDSKADWVLTHVKEDQNVSFMDGAILPILSEECVIRCQDGRGVSAIEAGELRVYCKPEFTGRRVRDFLKKYLRELCMQRACAMAERIGKSVREVRIRDTRSRWGSCSAGGSLTFHWQLVFATPAILDYLIAHEVAHLKEMNHSKKFWDTVAALCPNYSSARKWLKAEGHTLHRFGK